MPKAQPTTIAEARSAPLKPAYREPAYDFGPGTIGLTSICITVKDRSRVEVEGGGALELLPNCIASIVSAIPTSIPRVEIVVSDFTSVDWPLREWLPDLVGDIPLVIEPVDGAFSRGRGLNAAAMRSRGETLLFLDADMLIDEAVWAAVIDNGLRSYFPICWSYTNPEHTEGYWRATGYGNCVLPRTVLQKVGGWVEFSRWGGEDNVMFNRVGKLGPPKRERLVGLYHQWHPDHRAWKNRFYEAVKIAE